MADLLNPVSHFRQHFGNGERHVVPARVAYLTVFNPEFGKDDSEDGLMEQILCYVDNAEGGTGNNTKLRQVGLIQGMDSFSKEFSSNEPLRHIDTDQTRIVIEKVELNFYIVAAIELTKVIDPGYENESDDEERSDSQSRASVNADNRSEVKIEHNITTHLAPPAILNQDLKNAYNFFKFHYGTFSSIIGRSSVELLKTMLQPWWTEFVRRWDLTVNNKGFLQLLNSYKLSSKSISFSNSSNIKNVNLITEKLSEFFQLNSSKLIDMVIFNPMDMNMMLRSSSSEPADTDLSSNENKLRLLVEEYGVVFKGFDIISNESLIDIYNWLEKNNFVGLLPLNLLSDNIPKNFSIDQDSILGDAHQEESYFNPFSNTFHTIANFFTPEKETNSDEISAPLGNQVESLNLMLRQMSNKKHVTKGHYLIGVHEKLASDEPISPNISATTSPNPDNILNSPNDNTEISSKRVFVKLSNSLSEGVASQKDNNDLLECDLVVYEVGGLVFVLVFEDGYEDLNSMMFYEQLEENVIELFESIDEFFKNNCIKISNTNDKTKQKENKSSRHTESNDFKDYLTLKTFLLPFGMFLNNNDENAQGAAADYLRDHIEEDTVKLEKYKSTFYYIVYVPELNFYQTSLPMIPKPEEVFLSSAHAQNENALTDSGFLDPRYTFDLQVSRIQALHLHNQLISQFGAREGEWPPLVEEKLVNTDKFWWVYYNKFGGGSKNRSSQDKKTGKSTIAANYYETNNYERQVFVLKKFSNSRKGRNLLFTDKSEDFLSMLGDNVKVWFDNCITTGRV